MKFNLKARAASSWLRPLKRSSASMSARPRLRRPKVNWWPPSLTMLNSGNFLGRVVVFWEKAGFFIKRWQLYLPRPLKRTDPKGQRSTGHLQVWECWVQVIFCVGLYSGKRKVFKKIWWWYWPRPLKRSLALMSAKPKLRRRKVN